MKEVKLYGRCLCKRLDGTWEWDAPIWCSEGMWADCIVKGRQPFKNQKDALKDMNQVLKNCFGITRKTPKR